MKFLLNSQYFSIHIILYIFRDPRNNSETPCRRRNNRGKSHSDFFWGKRPYSLHVGRLGPQHIVKIHRFKCEISRERTEVGFVFKGHYHSNQKGWCFEWKLEIRVPLLPLSSFKGYSDDEDQGTSKCLNINNGNLSHNNQEGLGSVTSIRINQMDGWSSIDHLCNCCSYYKRVLWRIYFFLMYNYIPLNW